MFVHYLPMIAFSLGLMVLLFALMDRQIKKAARINRVAFILKCSLDHGLPYETVKQEFEKWFGEL